MNDTNNKIGEDSGQFRPAVGSTVTYAVSVFLFFHILAFLIPALDWIWHMPPPLTLLGSLALGVALHWLVFNFRKLFSIHPKS